MKPRPGLEVNPRLWKADSRPPLAKFVDKWWPGIFREQSLTHALDFATKSLKQDPLKCSNYKIKILMCI